MILTALKDLAEREGLVTNPAFEPKPVSYLIVVDSSGRYINRLDTAESAPGGKKKPVPKRFPVPRPFPGARRSGTEIDPGFLVDNASFVLGINTPDERSKKHSITELRRRQEAFRALVVEAERATSDEALKAVRLFLDSVIDGKFAVPMPDALTTNALFAFVYSEDGDLLVHERSPVAEYWSQLRSHSQQPLDGKAMTFNCLITGELCVPVDKHPLLKVPGGTGMGIALVSFDDPPSWSYGLERNENAPVSRYAAEAYTSGLARLLDAAYPNPRDGTPMPKRNVRLSNDTIVVFWSREASEVPDLFSEAIQADPEAVAALYNATWKGRPIRLDDPTAFYALTLSGAQGRATVRNWFESTVRDVVCNVRQHFDDLHVVRPKAQEGQPFPLWQLLRSTAIRGKSENIHPNLSTEMFQAILKGQRYPRILLDAALRRVRAEREVFPARDLFPERAALIKAYLARAKRLRMLASDFPEVKPMLDKECPNTAYRLGRLFAVLEKLQADATGAGTTIRDRYYGAASATPVVVFGQLLRKAPHHTSKIPHAPFYEKLIQEILDVLRPDKAFPPTLTLEEQGLFALGYYHQRQDLFTKRTDRETFETPERRGE
jgi:CRISPR-associated protein Csd1